MSKNELIELFSSRDTGSPAHRVVRALAERGAASAIELSRMTGLAKSTMSALVAELKESGVIIEPDAAGEIRASGRGRPAVQLSLNPQAGSGIGVLPGPDFIRIALVDAAHGIRDERSLDLEPGYSLEQAVEVVFDLVSKAYADAGLRRDTLLGLGIAMPGPFNRRTGLMLRSTLLPKWVGLDIRARFSERFGVPVLADNESNCAAVAEMTWGAALGKADFLYAKFDEGVGGAIISGGHVIRGALGAAGEFGHFIIDPDGPLCTCGSRGCLEALMRWDTVLRPARALFGDDITFPQVAHQALKGDPSCARLISDAAMAAGRGLASICAVLNPPLIVLGGRYLLAGEIFLRPAQESFDRNFHIRAEPGAASVTPIIAGAFANNRDSTLGAVGLVLRERPFEDDH